jgi:hypothetical protein
LLKEAVDNLRFALASPFSRSYAAKRRWLRERDEWESLGIAQTGMRKKVYVVSRTGAVCITVSKCANTTMKFMLHPEGKSVPSRVHEDDYLLTRLTDTGRTLNDLLDGSARIFTFARHPVSRFWSAYFTKISGRSERKIASDVASHLRTSKEAAMSPELVLDYVRAVSPVVVDEHICPQWACTGVEKLPINFIGKVETMREDVNKLVEMGYLDEGHARRFQHLNPSVKIEIPEKERIDRIVRDVYAKDMELFGYD